jgi:hypothetical protein
MHFSPIPKLHCLLLPDRWTTAHLQSMICLRQLLRAPHQAVDREGAACALDWIGQHGIRASLWCERTGFVYSPRTCDVHILDIYRDP